MIEVTYDKSLAIVKLAHGITNALNLELVRELATTIERLSADPKVRALILSSTNEKFFSIGFDIPELYELPQEDFHEFYETFNHTCLALYTLPKPTVAGLTGHAIAGGCILALCCDYRVIGEGRKLMGLNEIKLGVPVPYLASCILQNLIGGRAARQVEEFGEFYEAERLLRKGLVDEAVPQAEVLSRAREMAETLGSLPPEAYKRIKESRVEQVERRIRASWEERQQVFVEMWFSDEARTRLREAMKRF